MQGREANAERHQFGLGDWRRYLAASLGRAAKGEPGWSFVLADGASGVLLAMKVVFPRFLQ
jgi:hypothetical protein